MNREEYERAELEELKTGANRVPAGATYPNEWTAACEKSDESPAHQALEHFNSPEISRQLEKLGKETGLTFHLIQDLLEDVVGEIHDKVYDHKDYHDDYPDGSDASWKKIKQYDVIHDRLLVDYPDIEFSYYHWNDPGAQSGVFGALDDEDMALAKEWANGEIAPELALYEQHTLAINHGRLVAAYDPKSQKYSYYRDAEVLIKDVTQQKNKTQPRTR